MMTSRSRDDAGHSNARDHASRRPVTPRLAKCARHRPPRSARRVLFGNAEVTMTTSARTIAIVLGASLGACGPTVTYLDTGRTLPAQPRPTNAVALYALAPPRCPYRQVGVIEGHQVMGSGQETIDAMRGEAARRGADALILIDRQHSGHDGGHEYMAAAVVFVDGACAD